jgi:hypothetical protein
MARKTICRIEDAIPTEKHPQATFLTQNAMWSVMPQLSITTIKFTRNALRVFGVQFCGCDAAAYILISKLQTRGNGLFGLFSGEILVPGDPERVPEGLWCKRKSAFNDLPVL